MIELKDENILKMEEYQEDALADACYTLDNMISLMDYMNIYNIINEEDSVVNYEDICKAQEVLDTLSNRGNLQLIKIKV